jgi:adenylosuccinate synthase
MPLDVIVGTQWGDEGKGRLTDLLASESDWVARFSGGDNAGHTVTVEDQIVKLHLVPSGILQAHTICALGAGMVINPAKLVAEIDQLTSLGVDTSPDRIKLSTMAHVITPAHLALDGAEERHRGDEEIGTTKRGIGPAYTDKAARRGIRAAEMRDPAQFAARIQEHVRAAGEVLEKIYAAEPPDPEGAAQNYAAYARRLRPYLAETSALVDEALREGQVVLCEGAQGTLLDLDYGTYPYVTSSNPIAPAALLGLGVGAGHLRRVIGVAKAFQTRVGGGPFPTELHGTVAHHLRGTGEHPWDEFGTTTGRPRRVGWLDLVLLRYAARVNGLTEMALTKLDVLSGLNRLKVCTAYERAGERFERLPAGPQDLAAFEPRFEELPGWEEDLRDARAWEDLPSEAQGYLDQLQAWTGVPIRMASVGPERNQIAFRGG